jgi:hypothetical protein
MTRGKLIRQAAEQGIDDASTVSGKRVVNIERAFLNLGWGFDPSPIDDMRSIGTPTRSDQHQESTKQHEIS